VELLVDRTSIESFANDGEVSSTRYALPKGNGLSVKAEGGTVKINSFTVHPLRSAWPENGVSTEQAGR
jgi:fructan beta-fructosidase